MLEDILALLGVECGKTACPVLRGGMPRKGHIAYQSFITQIETAQERIGIDYCNEKDEFVKI